MRVVMDGYNVLYGSSYANREKLIEATAAYCKLREHKCTIVFDGTHGGRGDLTRTSQGGVEVLYTPLTVTADEEIERLLSSGDWSHAVIVSSDRRVQAAAIRARAAYVRAEEFVRKLEHPNRSESDASPGHKRSKIDRQREMRLRKL